MNVDEGVRVLLEHYRAVLEGLPDPGKEHRRADDVLALMCSAWNSPSYQQLERLLNVMHQRWPRHRQALRTRYERYSERRVAWCKRCGEHPAQHVGRIHSHPPGRAVGLRPKIVRVLPPDDDPWLVEEAIEWLVRHWKGELQVPKAVAEIEAERMLKAA